jgi:predicted XRE-type DNA-binding protein
MRRWLAPQWPIDRNALADLDLPGEVERQTELCLAVVIGGVIDSRRLNQTRADERLGVDPPTIKAIVHYKVGGFSLGRLIALSTATAKS